MLAIYFPSMLLTILTAKRTLNVYFYTLPITHIIIIANTLYFRRPFYSNFSIIQHHHFLFFHLVFIYPPDFEITRVCTPDIPFGSRLILFIFMDTILVLLFVFG